MKQLAAAALYSVEEVLQSPNAFQKNMKITCEEVMKISNHFQKSSHMKNQEHYTDYQLKANQTPIRMDKSNARRSVAQDIELSAAKEAVKVMRSLQAIIQCKAQICFGMSTKDNHWKRFLEDDDSSDDSIFIVDPGWDDYCLQELKLNRPVPCYPDARRARIICHMPKAHSLVFKPIKGTCKIIEKPTTTTTTTTIVRVEDVELIVIDDLLFHLDGSVDLALQESAKRIFPLCKSYLLINQFVESRSQFKCGLVNHAFAAALRALLLSHQAMVAQLEHQFRLGRLSIQGLWFYCQPMMGWMQALPIVIKKASAHNFVGQGNGWLCSYLGLISNIVQGTRFEISVIAMAGNYSVRFLLEKMIESANSAYLGILERWVYEGVIDDTHDEFFIAENKSLQKESLTQDYDAMYWRQRYSLKDDIPSFLANSAETILTGKYLKNVMRECGHSVQVQNSKLMNFEFNDHYLECIKSAYDFASGQLLNLMKDKLRSIKHYLLLDQGDFLVHFMDIARDELAKAPNEISVEKLQSLLDLALRSTAAAADPLHEDVTCSVDTCSLLKRLSTLKDLQTNETVSEADTLEEPLRITGVETFSVNYKPIIALFCSLYFSNRSFSIISMGGTSCHSTY
ncbi:gamma-tubulin complex component 2 [Tanacetum coccineum]